MCSCFMDFAAAQFPTVLRDGFEFGLPIFLIDAIFRAKMLRPVFNPPLMSVTCSPPANDPNKWAPQLVT